MSGENSFLCSICFIPVNLKNCKIDELARPLHEDCYAKWLGEVKNGTSEKKPPAKAGDRRRIKMPPE